MKKSYKIEVDCPNCAAKMEMAANKTEGVKEANVNFMLLKMKVEFEDGADPQAVMEEGFNSHLRCRCHCDRYLLSRRAESGSYCFVRRSLSGCRL